MVVIDEAAQVGSKGTADFYGLIPVSVSVLWFSAPACRLSRVCTQYVECFRDSTVGYLPGFSLLSRRGPRCGMSPLKSTASSLPCLGQLSFPFLLFSFPLLFPWLTSASLYTPERSSYSPQAVCLSFCTPRRQPEHVVQLYTPPRTCVYTRADVSTATYARKPPRILALSGVYRRKGRMPVEFCDGACELRPSGVM